MTGPSRMALRLALGLAVAAPPFGASMAQSRPTVFGGGGVGADRLAYLGVTAPLTGAARGRGLAFRGTLSASENSYRSGGVRVESQEVRGEAALLYQASGAWGYFDAGVGARYTDTDLSPNDPGNPNRGSKWDPVLSASGESSPSNPWQVAGFASYGFNSEDYFVRGEINRAVTPALRLGVEAIVDGDPNYDRRRAGAVATFGRTGWQVRFAAGAADSKAKDGAYASLGFRRTF